MNIFKLTMYFKLSNNLLLLNFYYKMNRGEVLGETEVANIM
jgi:hypothetical protein